MKVLFLDVDGVLNSAEHDGQLGHAFGIDEFHVAQLARIVAQTKCMIVVSSSWRHGGIGPGSDFYDQLSQCESSGPVLASIVGATGIDNRGRGQEILNWVNASPQVTRVAIVDDIEMDMDPMVDSFFQTDSATGLTPEIADAAIAHLNGAP